MEKLAREEAENIIERMRQEAEPEPLTWYVFITTTMRTRMRKRLRSGREKVYEGYRVTIPVELAKQLSLDEDPELVIAVAKPKWYHGILYTHPAIKQRIWPRLPPYAKAEICLLGHAPELLCKDYKTITVIASEEELRELGLEPGKPITLKELLKRAKNSTS